MKRFDSRGEKNVYMICMISHWLYIFGNTKFTEASILNRSTGTSISFFIDDDDAFSFFCLNYFGMSFHC